ncbi:MAG: UDP-N-acetylmuramoyl-L-alanyl-D-glutamate--2,6-diaminopimelate ligase [Flavobacteriales bacterium]|jgi:UDP-N-acetylmuramoyl-L-alanyl-D-glutamate--2,6-diaminopimelate ligase|nr:UDP-N-acetylmuramoyl-L-alanyl-D-glutamate--2,6-diaminopimelate ligase [Flavobacteriales bacterium]MBT7481732.1 UDP-N-acetylmuramoyl-L-alanyl-D-glutamate--2,6-diaminopimelate ligase [Flavobacteriales bacterium]
MFLKDLLYKTSLNSVVGNINSVSVSEVQFDSRKVNKGDLFVAINGVSVDGHLFIDTAIKKGAKSIVLETIPKNLVEGICYVEVENSSQALSVIASNYYNNPSEKIKLIGVTGTNGKTTIVSLLFQLFVNLGYQSGMLSTIHNKIGNKIIESSHTTGDSLQINSLLSTMVEHGCDYCFMEVSSHAIHQNRVSNLHFDGGIFTNISHDHLDYHKDFKEYINTKKIFFDNLDSSAFALTNKDDKNGRIMISNTKAIKLTYSLKSMADYKCKLIENRLDGMHLNIQNYELWVRLIGEFNAYNLLSVYAVAIQLGLNNEEVLEQISNLHSVEGRFQTIRTIENITAVVDYAHTPDALENVLKTINSIRNNNENVITVVGCGGDRDKTKRPKMAAIACNNSSQVIITSDNPRTENTEDIIEDMIKGLDPVQKKKTLVISDREQAIKTACTLSKEGDIILVAGKGHEKYQEINGEKFPFEDMQHLKESLNLKTN